METIKETLQSMISLLQVQDVEVRDNASLLGKIISQNYPISLLQLIQFFNNYKEIHYCNFIHFFSLTVNPATANPLNATKTTPVPATTTPPPFGTYKFKKNRKMFSFHALTLYRSPMSIRLMF